MGTGPSLNTLIIHVTNNGRLEAKKWMKISSWLGSKKLKESIKIVIRKPSQWSLSRIVCIYIFLTYVLY